MPFTKNNKISETHGLSYHPLYRFWMRMMQRCYSHNNASYKRYGGRGISVCESWHSVENFIRDMEDGFVEGLTLDRIDNNKGYSKENCRWATQKEQANNRHNNRVLDYNGESKTCSEWADILGISSACIIRRLNSGKSVEDALSPKTVIKLTYSGKTQTMSQWAKDLNININTLRSRYQSGLPVDKVLAKNLGL